MTTKVTRLAESLPIYFYVPIAYIILMGLFITTFFVCEYIDLPETDYSKIGLPENILFKYLFVVLLGPIFETFVFQAMPYYFLNLFEFMKRHIWITILIPAIIFGSLHDFSLQYILIATMMGIVFQYTYHVRSKKGDPFLSTYLLHALLNGISTTIQLF